MKPLPLPLKRHEDELNNNNSNILKLNRKALKKVNFSYMYIKYNKDGIRNMEYFKKKKTLLAY